MRRDAANRPWYAEEICIPAGPFVRGGGASASTTPQAEVFISAFYIDRFPVSNRRYRDCYDAGACPAPYVTEDWDDPATLDHPVHQIDWYAAEAFCRWDASSSGPRRLPTEAEWEKAARGPAPRMQDYPWGPTRCGTVPLWGCGDTVPPELVNRTLSPIDAYPSAASYYGVDLMIGGVRSWVSDWWSFSYYSDPASTLPDPSGPASGFYRVMRGPDGTTSSDQLYRRSESLPAAYWPRVGIRCARSSR
ncbi:MAG: formylglycine-generating enzyme family protein [Sandaracinaceae bacterium]|nr:formylglycine-generating enzyme family protein [Sandaracinaceae bacterium]